ncbi:hypothetical protein [Fusobacterium necrophorum]|uniref:hypothetical protein n=1 Tax=Fusobacterium necrophorum TaxID=859 RepID=UPI00370E65E0
MEIEFSSSELSEFKELSDLFSLEREGKIINHNIYAFFCSNKYPSSIQTIDFNDILEGDILVHNKSNKKCYIIDVQPLSQGVIVKYETDFQRRREQKAVVQNISIGSIGGSAIVGNQQYATIDNSSIQNLKTLISQKSEDKELLEKFLNRIEIVMEDNQPISKGTFAKFKDLLTKYPDIFNAAATILLKWLS